MYLLYSIVLLISETAALSYKEACLSGDFTRLSDLHQFVEGHVDTVEGEASKELFVEHLWKDKPLLMKGAIKHWKAYSLFSDEYLIKNHGDAKFYVDLRKDYSTKAYARRQFKLKDFIQRYKKENWYLDSMSSDPGFHKDIDLPSYLNITDMSRSMETAELNVNFYMSSGHTNSPLHYDGYYNVLSILRGKKEWIVGDLEAVTELRIDDYIDYPNVSPLNVSNMDVQNNKWICDIKWKRAVMHEGDTLFIPILWPHQVYSTKEENMAIGIWFNWAGYDDELSKKGFYDEEENIRNVSTIRDILVEHVKTRPKPCGVSNCDPIPNARTMHDILPPFDETMVSRDDDLLNPQAVSIVGREAPLTTMIYGTGAPGGSIANPYENTLKALNLGYRFIDTAQMYGNEKEIGRAVRDCKWKREAIAVATKIELEEYCNSNPDLESVREHVKALVDKSYEELNIGRIDVFLIHDTMYIDDERCLIEAWRGLEDKVREGRIQYLGVSNVNLDYLSLIYEEAAIPITFVQNVINPIHYDKDVYKFTRSHEMVIMAFGLTGDFYVLNDYKIPRTNKNPVIMEMAKEWYTSPVGVLYSWAARKKVLVITRTTNEEHMKSNLEEYRDICLGAAYIAKIDELFVDHDEFEKTYGGDSHDPSEL